MNPGDVKITDRVSAIEAIKRLNEEDLRFLNNLIVERLKLISQARATRLMASFTKGDQYCHRRRSSMECLSQSAETGSGSKKHTVAMIRQSEIF